MKIKYLSSIVFINDKMFFQALIDTHTNFILQSVLVIFYSPTVLAKLVYGQ